MYNRPLLDPQLVACPHCDLLQRVPDLEPGGSARCPRCDEELWRRRVDPLDRTLALAIAAAILFVIANSVPMIGLAVVGREASTTVMGGVLQLWRDGRETVAILVLLTAIVAPALQIGFMLVVVISARRGRPAAWVGQLLRHHPTTCVWSMIEVMMIGVLVSVIKIAELATVLPGTGMYVLGGLIFVLAAMQASFDSRSVWQRVEWVAERDARESGRAWVGARS